MEDRYDRPVRRSKPIFIVNRWMVFGMLIVACFLLTVTLSVFLWGAKYHADQPLSTAALLIIPAASYTPTNSANPIENPVGEEQAPSGPPSGEIEIDAFVQVVGTGGDGLRIRDNPGLGSEVLFLASESELFQVIEGPKEMDNYSWWRLVGPFDKTRQGWAVANFLEVVQKP